MREYKKNPVFQPGFFLVTTKFENDILLRYSLLLSLAS